MFTPTKATSAFSAPDLEKIKEFYQNILELKVDSSDMGLEIFIQKDVSVFVYPSTDYNPPEHTILNFYVQDLEKTVDELAQKGVMMEQYDMPGIKTNEKGIATMEGGPAAIAWLKDPADHIIALIQE